MRKASVPADTARNRVDVGSLTLALLVLVSVQSAADGPVVYFPFNGSTDDASGFGNHAVTMGAVPTEDRFGNPNSAYLVGDFGHLEVPDSDSLDISDAYSVAVWFRQDDMISSKGVIIGKGVNSAYSAYVYYGQSYQCPDPAALRRFQISVGGATTGWGDGPYFDCGTGEWRHVVVTLRTEPGGQHTGSLYVEGVFIDTIGLSGDFENNTAPLGIGKDGETAYRFAGAIDDLRLYDRELQPDEVVGLFNSLFIDGFESGSTSSWHQISP
jgi:hypothetical protein